MLPENVLFFSVPGGGGGGMETKVPKVSIIAALNYSVSRKASPGN